MTKTPYQGVESKKSPKSKPGIVITTHNKESKTSEIMRQAQEQTGRIKDIKVVYDA